MRSRTLSLLMTPRRFTFFCANDDEEEEVEVEDEEAVAEEDEDEEEEAEEEEGEFEKLEDGEEEVTDVAVAASAAACLSLQWAFVRSSVNISDESASSFEPSKEDARRILFSSAIATLAA